MISLSHRLILKGQGEWGWVRSWGGGDINIHASAKEWQKGTTLMKVELIQKLSSKSTPVFLLKEKGKIEAHPFFKLLAQEDRKYLTHFVKKTIVRTDFAARLMLPSGREILLLGAPEKGKFDHRKTILAARRAIVLSRKEQAKNIALHLDDFVAPGFSVVESCELLAMQLEMANFEFVKYKTAPKEGWIFVKDAGVVSSQSSGALKNALRAGKIMGEEINKARVLSNTPGGDMTPALLAKEAQKSAREAGFKVKVLDEKVMKKLRMGGVLGVAKGSDEPPRFIIMEYLKGKKKEKPVVLVGKGVTFDTGGLNLKPEQAIYEMHMDMSGGAAVIHAITALARLKIKKNIVGLVPAVENMPSGSSYHPGDQLKTMSGKTIEVLNTDAEGRVILADALTYAKRYKPQLVVDVATLAGAAMVALGQRASALLTPEKKLETQFREMGEKTGDLVWPLPLWDEYEEDIKGTFGDVANTGKTRYGGAITAALFLRQFVRDQNGEDAYPWVHIDIAPRMTAIEGEYLAKGAAGAPIALLVHYVRNSIMSSATTPKSSPYKRYDAS